jgi:Photosynthesis system II assembly factor YCF48/Putative zinc-finger
MNKLPNIVRARLSAVDAGDHPDPDLLTAFAEQALAEQERFKVLAHLSRCSDCREVLAVAMPSLSTAALATASSIDTARRRSWFHWPSVRWGAAAACVVIVGSAVLMKRDVLMKPPGRMVALQKDDAGVTYSSNNANNKTKDLPAVSAPQPASPPPSVRDEERAVAAPPASTRRQAQLTTPVPDQKKALASNFTQPTPPPVLAGRMRPEFAHSATGSGAAVGGAAGGGSLASTPTTNESLDLLPSNGKIIAAPVAPSKPAAQATEEVQVTAAVPVIETDAAGVREKQELPGKAKAPSGVAMYDALVAAPSQDSSTQTVLAKEAARKAEMKRVETLRPPVARWTISADGQLQHSVDSGKTWQPVAVAENATFRALSANGPDLWVGGASGLLYHSTDAGTHWMQVKPATADATLTADIAAIEFVNVRQGKITTSTGEVWTTADGGQTWRRPS